MYPSLDTNYRSDSVAIEQRSESLSPMVQGPHVKPICANCNSTHLGPFGMPLGCQFCVCIKCKGTGVILVALLEVPCLQMEIL